LKEKRKKMFKPKFIIANKINNALLEIEREIDKEHVE
jgi:hypothetical protein